MERRNKSSIELQKLATKLYLQLLNNLLTKFYFQQFVCTPVNN